MTDEVERTADGRQIVVGGRKWRASDPSIPDRLRTELVGELMSARREVGAAQRAGDDSRTASARARVDDAKRALGERGRPWWEPPDDDADQSRAGSTIRALLRNREPTSSICPSEVARILRFDGWRGVIAIVRVCTAELLEKDAVVLTRSGSLVRSFDGGPVRIGRGPMFPDAPPVTHSD